MHDLPASPPPAHSSCRPARDRRALARSAFALFLAGLGLAGRPVAAEVFTEEGWNRFSQGEFAGVGLTHPGALAPAPSLELVAKPDQPVVWTALRHPDGTVFLGTGHDGKVLAVQPDGTIVPWFEPGAVFCRALGLDQEGRLLAGTAPEARLFRVSAPGRAELLCALPARYLWALAVGPAGEVFLATGQPARLYRWSPDRPPGEAPELWFEADQDHLTCLALQADGAVLAGTSPQGLVYRMTGPQQAFALASTGAQEVKALTPGPAGSTWVLTYSAESGREAPPPSPTGEAVGAVEVVTVTPSGLGESGRKDYQPPPAALSPTPPAAGPAGRSDLWLMDHDGLLTPVPGLRALGGLFAVAVPPEGGWLAGASEKGKIYQGDVGGDWRLLAQVPDGGEIAAFLPPPSAGSAAWVVTSNPAGVWRLSPAAPPAPTYTSRVLDARQPARWGAWHLLAEPGSPPPVAFTRSGNTPQPGSAWSEWAKVAPGPEGPRVASPPARYLQFQLRWPVDSAAAVWQARIFHREPNQAPVLAALRVFPRGFDALRNDSPAQPLDQDRLLRASDPDRLLEPAEPRPPLRPLDAPGRWTALWRAADPNGDPLEFRLEVRSDRDPAWTILADRLEEEWLTWDARGWPDGPYRLRLTLSDRPGQPDESALALVRLSEWFVVDNSPPLLGEPVLRHAGGRTTLTVAAEENRTVLVEARLRLDGGDEQALWPADGLADSPRETFTRTFPTPPAGAHSLLLTVVNEHGLAATRTWSFAVP